MQVFRSSASKSPGAKGAKEEKEINYAATLSEYSEDAKARLFGLLPARNLTQLLLDRILNPPPPHTTYIYVCVCVLCVCVCVCVRVCLCVCV
jgi:hypothetical protein